ncbi:MAG: enamine deaminase RidA [Acidimicrobiia bacterium]|nr:MAG: enamine deaminase RidA [Acidimicrobiia bacterium]
MRFYNPEGVAGPFATYSHGVELEGPHRLVFGAGQVGVAPDGRVGEGIEEQARLVWDNIRKVLDGAGMGIPNIVQLNMLLIDRAHAPAAMAIREEALAGHRPASTLMYVAGLASPELLIEIDFVAAQPV